MIKITFFFCLREYDIRACLVNIFFESKTIFNEILFMVGMDPHKFLKLGNKYTKSLVSTPKLALRRFKSFFGITLLVCSIVWDELKNEAPYGAEHLLWTINFRCRRKNYTEMNLDLCQTSVESECGNLKKKMIK